MNTSIKQHLFVLIVTAIVYGLYTLIINLIFFQTGAPFINLILFSLLGSVVSIGSCYLFDVLNRKQTISSKVLNKLSVHLGMQVTALSLFGIKTGLICLAICLLFKAIKAIQAKRK